MARIQITAVLTPEPHEVDEGDPSGLTVDAYEELMGRLVGFDDVEIERLDE